MKSCMPIKLPIAARLIGCATATVTSWAAYGKLQPILSDSRKLVGYDPVQILDFITKLYNTPRARKAKTFPPDTAKSYLIEEGYITEDDSIQEPQVITYTHETGPINSAYEKRIKEVRLYGDELDPDYLVPCPFCGASNVSPMHSPEWRVFYVHCGHCRAQLGFWQYGRAKKIPGLVIIENKILTPSEARAKAIKHWNTRALLKEKANGNL